MAAAYSPHEWEAGPRRCDATPQATQAVGLSRRTDQAAQFQTLPLTSGSSCDCCRFDNDEWALWDSFQTLNGLVTTLRPRGIAPKAPTEPLPVPGRCGSSRPAALPRRSTISSQSALPAPGDNQRVTADGLRNTR